MSTKSRLKKKLSEQEVDQLVVAQVNEDAAWGKPVRVRKAKAAVLSIPADLAAVWGAFLFGVKWITSRRDEVAAHEREERP